MNRAAVPNQVGLLEDLADPDEAMAYLDAVLEDGDKELIQLALRHIIEAQEIGQDDDDLRFSREGWLRLRPLMVQA